MSRAGFLAPVLFLMGTLTAQAHPGHGEPHQHKEEASAREPASVSDQQLKQFTRALQAIEALQQQAPPLAQVSTREEAARRQALLQEQMRQVLHQYDLTPQEFHRLRDQAARHPDPRSE